MTPAAPSRAERKEQTRRALLDAALDLTADRPFDSISLREITRAAGIVPTAFYRHFESLEDLRASLTHDSRARVDAALTVLEGDGTLPSPRVAIRRLSMLVAAEPRAVRFLVHEPGPVAGDGGPWSGVVRDVTVGLARTDVAARWPSADLDTAATLLVQVVVDAARDLLAAPTPERDARAVRAERHLRLVALGIAHWRT